MIKRMVATWALATLLLMGNAFAGSGELFNVSATGTPANVNITLCLNGKGALSCQNYTVSALTLTISASIPNHVYPFIGIKINTPGYTLDNSAVDCTPSSNGYCLFSASQSQAKTVSLVGAGALTLSPTTTVVYSSSNPSVASTSVTLSAKVSSDSGAPSEGSVSFSGVSGCTTQSVTSGIATCTTSSLAAGTYTIVATYTGAGSFANSTSASFSQSVVTTVTATVPAAPQDVAVIPGNGQVTVNWYPPANTGGATIMGYTVRYGTTASAVYSIAGCTTSSASGLSCTSSGLTNGTPYTFTVFASNANGTGPAAYSSSVTPESTLTASPANLALSGLGSGASRTITITNNSGSSVTISSVSTPSPSLPSGTTVNTSQVNACASGLVLANAGICTITVTPGSTVTSGPGSALCTTGIAPTSSVITVTDSNSDTVTANVVVLGYGCQYQEGYLFSIDDTTPTTSSIGGTVVTLGDQSSGINWSSSAVSIWGIDDASTIGSPNPNASSVYPATLTTGQLNCNAVNDGACATNNVSIYYGAAASNAVNLCKATSNGYTDWYLPSVCELGPFGSTGVGAGNYPKLINSQACTNTANIQNLLVTTSIVTNFNAQLYWSSTETSSSPQYSAWFQNLLSTGSAQSADNKVTASYGVRCSRALTL